MSTFKTPILLLIFNREDTAEKVFQRIKEIRPLKLYIAADGPRESRKEEGELCKQTRDKVLSMIDWDCELKTLFRESNLGCKTAVSSAIDWFFKNEEMGIILEDDCLPDLSFFKYCEEALIKYKDDEQVCVVSGNNFFESAQSHPENTFFSIHNHIWGWATWRRSWQHYDVTMKKWPELSETNFLGKLFKTNQEVKFWKNCFDEVYYRNIDTWDYQWMLTCWMRNALTVLPEKNLVENIGFDERATHTKTNREIPLVAKSLTFPLVYSEKIVRNYKYDNALWEKVLKPKSFFTRVLNKLRK